MIKKGMTQEKALKEFEKYACFIPLNEDEGYYECQGFKSLDTRKLFVMWAKETYGLILKE